MLTGEESDLVGAVSSLLAADSQDGVDGSSPRERIAGGGHPVGGNVHPLAEGDERSIEMTAVNLVGSPEVGGIVVSLADRTELRRAISRSRQRRADFDALTGLLNRRAFEDQGRELFKDGVAGPAFVAALRHR